MTIDASRLRISVQEQERWRRRLSVTVPAAQVVEEENKAAAKLASRVKMKGFRKGHVPKQMLASRFGGALRQEALDRLINEAYRHALAAENLRPITDGEIEDVSYEPQQDLTFSIAFDVQPEIELGRLGGFVVERPRAEITDDHVAEILGNIREQNGAWKPVDEGTPEPRDLVAVQIRRLDGDAPDAEAKDYEFVLGEGQAISEIEDAIKTLQPGAEGEFDVTFPEDFPDEKRRGVTEHIEVRLQGRKVLELPELDDDLARQVGSGAFETLDELKTRIREDLERDAADQVEGAIRGRLLDFLLEANPFEVPRSMVERYAEGVLGEQSSIPPERLEEIKESIRPEAERAVKRLLVIDRVAHIRNLHATEEDLDRRIEEIAEKNQTAPEKVYASLQKSGRLEALERELTERKVFEFLKGQSEITEAPAA
jgi:trigger factor